MSCVKILLACQNLCQSFGTQSIALALTCRTAVSNVFAGQIHNNCLWKCLPKVFSPILRYLLIWTLVHLRPTVGGVVIAAKQNNVGRKLRLLQQSCRWSWIAAAISVSIVGKQQHRDLFVSIVRKQRICDAVCENISCSPFVVANHSAGMSLWCLCEAVWETRSSIKKDLRYHWLPKSFQWSTTSPIREPSKKTIHPMQYLLSASLPTTGVQSQTADPGGLQHWDGHIFPIW